MALTHRERQERNARIVKERWRGVSVGTIAAAESLTVRAVQKIVAAWDSDLDVVAGLTVNPKEEVEAALHGLDQVIEDLAVLFGETKNPSVKLGAINSRQQAVVLRLQLLAAAGLIPRNLAAPREAHKLTAVMAKVADICRQHNVSEELLQELADIDRVPELAAA